MAEFARVASDIAFDYSNGLSEDVRRKFHNVLGYRAEKRQVYAHVYLDLDNLENLFGLLDMEASLEPDETTSRLRDDLIYVLVKTLEMTYKTNPNVAQELQVHKLAGDVEEVRRVRREGSIQQQYLGFADALRSQDSILSFNYDTALEEALLATGVAPDYGFGTARWADTTREQLVLKLHGSINFIQTDNGTDVVDFELLTNPTTQFYQLGKPLLVPPTWNKTSPGDPVQAIWSKAWDKLRTATHLVFIGYSLPESDLFFRYLLASALAKNETLQSVTVLDRGGDTLRRYGGFFSEALRSQQKFRPMENLFENAWRQALGLA